MSDHGEKQFQMTQKPFITDQVAQKTQFQQKTQELQYAKPVKTAAQSPTMAYPQVNNQGYMPPPQYAAPPPPPMQPNPINQNNNFATPHQYPVPPQPYYQQNIYAPPPPAPTLVGVASTTVVVGSGGAYCPVCRRNTGTLSVRVTGATTWIWCLIIWFFTGFFCFIPFCIDSCKDTNMICTTCKHTKSRIPASFL